MNGYYKPGDNYGLCEECGRRRRASELVTRWDNLLVCHERSRCYEEEHPQNFVRAVEDNTLPAVISPEPPDTFIVQGSVTAEDL